MIRCSLKQVILCLFFIIFSMNSFSLSFEDEEKVINEFMQQFIYAYETKNLDDLMNFYDVNAVVIGTGNDEILQGKNEIREGFKKDFMQRLSAAIEPSKIAIYTDKRFAFISYFLNVNVITSNQLPFQSRLRFSAVLIKDQKKISILQSHLSAALADQKAGDSFPGRCLYSSCSWQKE